MDFIEYEHQLVTRLRLKELRTAAARHAMVAALGRGEARRGLRARVGQGLVRLGLVIEGRSRASSGRAPLAAR